MKWFWIGMSTVALVAFIVFFVRSRGGEAIVASELDQKIVQLYIKAVAEGDYRSAYERLSKSYCDEVPFEKFKGGHEKRRIEKGVISSCRMIHDQVLHNLFSSKRDVQLMYELFYGDRRETGWVKLEEEEKNRFAIEGTYRENAADTLDFYLW